jgi:hypothetical protein
MFGSFLPNLWSTCSQSLLGSREPTLLCNQVECPPETARQMSGNALIGSYRETVKPMTLHSHYGSLTTRKTQTYCCYWEGQIDFKMKTKVTKKKLYWRICGYDSSKPIFERTVELGQFTENQMKHLLMTLTAKAGLGYDEIVGAYATRRTNTANVLLIVHRDSEYPTFTCGSNPHFAASVVDENGKITRFPKLS